MKKIILILTLFIILIGCMQTPDNNQSEITEENETVIIEIDENNETTNQSEEITTENITSINNSYDENTTDVSLDSKENETIITEQLKIPEEIMNNCVGFLVGDPTEIQNAQMIGAGWIRPHPGPFSWGFIERTNNVYHFDETDKYVLEAQKNNISILATLFPYADWDQDGNEECLINKEDQFYTGCFGDGIPKYRCKPNDMNEYKKFLSDLVERYDGDGINDMPGLEIPILYWEISNEPSMQAEDLTFFKGTPKEYVEILEASYDAITSACPDCVIVQGGASGIHKEPMEFWEDVYSLGGAEYYDISNIHFISYGDQDTLNVKDFKDLMDEYEIEKPIWITEAEIGSSDKLINSFEGALEAGADKVFFTTFKIGKMGPPEMGEYSEEYANLPDKCPD